MMFWQFPEKIISYQAFVVKMVSGFLKLVVRKPVTHASQLRTCHTSVVHWAYTPNDLLLLFIKDLLVMDNQYFWWASKIRDPGCPGTTTSHLDFRNPGY
jgi:hypothetical protein